MPLLSSIVAELESIVCCPITIRIAYPGMIHREFHVRFHTEHGDLTVSKEIVWGESFSEWIMEFCIWFAECQRN